ncbi:MAG: hypothetical protein HFH75_04580 [Lachnospiraceae bacterium]|nr:hypothetical protein [Lachnospiraceae bacterium]
MNQRVLPKNGNAGIFLPERVTHRLGYIRDVDEILVLKDGKITEHGTPVDLLHDKTTFFHQLFEEQRSLYET